MSAWWVIQQNIRNGSKSYFVYPYLRSFPSVRGTWLSQLWILSVPMKFNINHMICKVMEGFPHVRFEHLDGKLKILYLQKEISVLALEIDENNHRVQRGITK